MADEKKDESLKDVKPKEATPTPVQELKEQPQPKKEEPKETPEVKPKKEVSEDVKPPMVEKSVYEKVREAMKSEREAKREAKERNTELEERIAKLESQKPEETYGDEERTPYEAKTDLLFLMNKDPFVKENLDLIEEKMTDNPNIDIRAAVSELKADFFDRIQKESSTIENKILKQTTPTATEEEVTPKRPKDSNRLLKDVLDGKVDVDPAQLEAIKHYLPRQQ